jgi:hypothetical protein
MASNVYLPRLFWPGNQQSTTSNAPTFCFSPVTICWQSSCSWSIRVALASAAGLARKSPLAAPRFVGATMRLLGGDA